METEDKPKTIENETSNKIALLNRLKTKELVEQMHKLEDELEKTMIEEADFKNKNYGYIGESSEVKRIEAELVLQAQGTNENQRKAWLLRQRTENEELLKALTRQKITAFEHDNLHIKLEMTKKRLEGVKAVVALKTAQINFLAN